MTKAILAAAILVLGFSAGAGATVAHDGAAPLVLIESEFILPGRPFEVIVTDIGEDAPVDFAILAEQRTTALGSTRAAQDGHLMTELELPEDFPLGYAQLFATVPDVTSTSTWVYVGEPTASTVPPPSTQDAGPWWTDPSVIVLAMLLIGVIGAVGYLLVKPRRAKPQPVINATGPRRSSGKRSRR